MAVDVGRSPSEESLSGKGEADGSSVGRIREISSYQADYWACAIPDSLPPSPDRSSPHWNPNKEYEDLLDYAYPLKPRSTSIYGRVGQARGSRENGLWEFVASAERFSTPRPGKRGCSGTGSYFEPSPIAKASFARSASSHLSRGFAKDESSGPSSPGHLAANGRSWDTRGSSCPNYTGQVKSTSGFLPTTGMLPLRKEWESDEEFLSLPPTLKELESLAQFLSNLSLTIRTPGNRSVTPFLCFVEQMFCCQLEELIRWLYTVVDVTGSWVPPSPDAESVLASLRRYLEFRKDVADHRSLTESVLERGEALLDCMASNSPALKDTLALIAKQSEELESHAEHLYKSILAAVGGKDAGQDKEGSAHSCSLGRKLQFFFPGVLGLLYPHHTAQPTPGFSMEQHQPRDPLVTEGEQRTTKHLV
ncbi:Centrosomal protein [Lonchura striata]|uniref:Centrosomal protein n=1 Tax=Lonchura striata TaxID=40157 RepID=A0A218UV60_9PASE|nr:Centrosomal protein [Lonchura striata domestica]